MVAEDGESRPKSLVDLGKVFIEQKEAQMDYAANIGFTVPTGFMDLDHLTHGFHRQALTVLGGETGVGTTHLAFQMAFNAAIKYRAGVLYFTPDMRAEWLYERMLIVESGVDVVKVARGRLNETET